MSWRPLLEGDLAARAEEAIHAIAADLGEPALPSYKANAALFHGYLAKARGANAHHARRADELLEQAVEAIAAAPMRPSLYGGFTGIAWTAEHLQRVLFDADDDMNEEIDEFLLAALEGPWPGDYDLINGLTGFGVYALERIARPSAIRCLEAIIDRLDETAESLEQGISWFTRPELIPPLKKDDYPHGGYNLGVAHGVPGVIGLLADACRRGIRAEKARPLLDGAVRWVLSQRLSGHRGGSFAAWVLPGIAPQPVRLAWCYGDPGIASAILSAARATGNEEWERAGLDIALHAATAAPEFAGVVDAGLCHGALGLAHLYNRIYQTGGGEPFADAARCWYGRALDLRRPGRGVAGFETWDLGADMQLAWQADRGFLSGASGVGLALLAGLTDVEPEWDRLLLAGSV